MLGCSGILAAIAFVVAFVVTLFLPIDFGLRLGLAGMVAGIVFLAALLLCLGDHDRDEGRRGIVRRWLDSRAEIDSEAFLASVRPEDQDLALCLREGLARFFGASPMKIAIDDPLSSYDFEGFMPVIYMRTLGPAIRSLGAECCGKFPRQPLVTFRDLIQEVRLQAADEPA
ncbi:MAG: hypothetical protein U0800_14545 [Isosphaeraceae bacterium]